MRRILEGRATPLMPNQPEHDRRPALRHRDIGNRAIVAARDPDELILAQHLAAPRPAMPQHHPAARRRPAFLGPAAVRLARPVAGEPAEIVHCRPRARRPHPHPPSRPPPPHPPPPPPPPSPT